MSKNKKLVLGLAGFGLAITAVFVAYQVLTDSSSASPLSTLDALVILGFVILCPPSLLAVPLIDVEPGHEAFYIVWIFIGLMNAFLYALVGLVVVVWKSGKGPSGARKGLAQRVDTD
jgi:hypothetical protein